MLSDLETYGEPLPPGSTWQSSLTSPQFTLSRSFIYSMASTCMFDLAPCYKAILKTAYLRWEFFSTLNFEWEVFTGIQPWKWSFVVYLTAWLLALMSIILTFIGFNLTTQFNCNVSWLIVQSPLLWRLTLSQAWFWSVLVSSWFSVTIASFLLVLHG